MYVHIYPHKYEDVSYIHACTQAGKTMYVQCAYMHAYILVCMYIHMYAYACD